MKATLSLLSLLLAPLAMAQTVTPPAPGDAAAPFFSAVARQQPGSLQLFEEVAGESAVSRPQTPNGAEESGPAFTLIGTSRFGDRYRARLRDANGEVIAVDVTPGQAAAVPGHPGFTIIAQDGRELQLRHPPGSPCREASNQGVSCAAGNTARLSLATAAAVEVAPEPQPTNRRRGRNWRTADDESADGDTPRNPFEVALRNARNLSEEELAELRRRAERFEGRRLDAADLPEGARIISTPFGDRIVIE